MKDSSTWIKATATANTAAETLALCEFGQSMFSKTQEQGRASKVAAALPKVPSSGKNNIHLGLAKFAATMLPLVVD